ncbi:hypothetical protein [Streptomyces sp. D54]|uniref:hypothetical protein n=1 Tax=Streptomyces sp. D54 TaxID=1290289 RepID=UPI003CED2AD8
MRKRVLKAALTAGALSGVIVAALATGRTAPVQEELTLRPVAEEGPGHAVEDLARAAGGEAADPEGRDHVLVEIVTSG